MAASRAGEAGCIAFLQIGAALRKTPPLNATRGGVKSAARLRGGNTGRQDNATV